jgi:hypothetical protein
MAAEPASSLSGPGPPPCTSQQHSCSSPAKQQSGGSSTCGRAWRGVPTGGRSHLPSVGTPVKRQPPEGELLQWAPHTKIHPNHLDHHLSHTFPGRTRPKKEDWLKKKDRKQRRPGCRRKKRKRKRGRAPAQGPSLSSETLSSVLGTASSLNLTL